MMDGSVGSEPGTRAMTMGLLATGEITFTSIPISWHRATIQAAAAAYEPLTGPSPAIEGMRTNSRKRSTQASSSEEAISSARLPAITCLAISAKTASLYRQIELATAILLEQRCVEITTSRSCLVSVNKCLEGSF